MAPRNSALCSSCDVITIFVLSDPIAQVLESVTYMMFVSYLIDIKYGYNYSIEIKRLIDQKSGVR